MKRQCPRLPTTDDFITQVHNIEKHWHEVTYKFRHKSSYHKVTQKSCIDEEELRFDSLTTHKYLGAEAPRPQKPRGQTHKPHPNLHHHLVNDPH
jgi:hypothetical protein